ncbi:MAG: hypothetical protein R3251_04350 [Candidatus Spechtbacterales bacterium]|nr:hypothetical protein [Candidatus Spechtbacterales bacterium]
MPSAIKLLKTSIDFYAKSFKTILGIILMPLFALLVALVVLFVVASFTLLLQKGSAFAFGVGFLLVVAVMLINIWQQAALYYYIKDKDSNVGILEYYRRSSPKFFTYFSTGLLYGIVVFAGFLFFIVPGIIFMTWFSLATLLVVFEDKDAIEAMHKSREYIKGHTGQVIWRLLVLFSFMIMVFMVIFGIAMSLFGGQSIITQAFSNIIAVLVGPIAPIFMFEIYKTLKNKEQATAPAQAS